jgi:tRNA threonylcarbamoyladenosine biosynthesis protein TsaE
MTAIVTKLIQSSELKAEIQGMPAPKIEILTQQVEQTQQLGYQLGQLLQPRDVVCLVGELGAGKTTFAAGIGRGWGSTSRLTSPTYTLVHEHHRPTDNQILYHIDAYRLETPEALGSVGFEDILEGDGPVIIEWPERLGEMLPPVYLWIEIETDAEETQRIFHVSAYGKRSEQLLAMLEASRK